MEQSIKHISFDLWMTLIRTHPEYKRKRAELFCHFFSVPDVDATEKLIRKTDLMANHINETTGGNIDALELYMIVLQDAHPEWKTFTIDAIKQFYDEAAALFLQYPVAPVDETVADALRLIADKGITMNILSNTGFIKGYVLKTALENMGLWKYFSFHIFSDETSYSKPHHAMFETVWKGVQELDNTIEKAAVLHFGDNPFADVEGAEKYGFSAALFSPEAGSFYQQVEKLLLGNTGR